MRYVSSYLLSVLGGNAAPSVDDLKNILGAVGVDANEESAALVVNGLKGKGIEELIAEGASRLVSVAGAAQAAAVPASAGAPAAAAAPVAESKKKEQPKEESEDEDMGFGLFD